MQSFQDSEKRLWSIDLTIGDVRRIQEAVAIDILSPPSEEGTFLDRFQTDPVLVCRCIFACQKDPGISEEEFLDALNGDSLREAVKAFWDGLVDFFQKIGRDSMAEVTQAYYQDAVEMWKEAAEDARRLMDLARKRAREEQQKAIKAVEKELSGGLSGQ